MLASQITQNPFYFDAPVYFFLLYVLSMCHDYNFYKRWVTKDTQVSQYQLGTKPSFLSRRM